MACALLLLSCTLYPLLCSFLLFLGIWCQSSSSFTSVWFDCCAPLFDPQHFLCLSRYLWSCPATVAVAEHALQQCHEEWFHSALGLWSLHQLYIFPTGLQLPCCVLWLYTRYGGKEYLKMFIFFTDVRCKWGGKDSRLNVFKGATRAWLHRGFLKTNEASRNRLGTRKLLLKFLPPLAVLL